MGKILIIAEKDPKYKHIIYNDQSISTNDLKLSLNIL